MASENRTMTETERVLLEMLRENTGRHFLDSGCAYGRNWERNEERDDASFLDAPDAVLTFRWGSPEIVVSVFQFLRRNLDYDATMDSLIRVVEAVRGTYGLETVALLFEALRNASEDIDIGGPCGSGEPMSVNTYNGEDALSQTLQYVYTTVEGTIDVDVFLDLLWHPDEDDVEDDIQAFRDAHPDGEIYLSGDYILLQIHGGCDVRGGYTDVRGFTGSGHAEYGILDNARAIIYDASVDVNHADGIVGQWMTENAGASWHPEGCWGMGSRRELQDFPIVETEMGTDETDAIVRDAIVLAERIGTEPEGTFPIVAAMPWSRDDAIDGFARELAERIGMDDNGNIGFPAEDSEEYRQNLVSRIALGILLPEQHGVIVVDDAGNGRSPYTCYVLQASMF